MIYNCFISNNPKLPSIGNPSTVFIGEYSYEEMSKLAIKAGSPISCFVKVLETEAIVTFFAQNGQEDGFCGHGLISVIKHLKINGLENVNTLISRSGVRVNAKVLENGISSLEIPVAGFKISSYLKADCVNFFNLKQEEILEVYKTMPIGDIVFEVSSPEALKNISLDPKKVAEFSQANNIRIMVFFSKGSSFKGIDAEIRVFCDKLYELEDVVCGSANISISNVLWNKYGISKYKVVQPFNFKTTGKIGGYQEIEYNPKEKILTLNGFATPSKERLRFEPLDIEFDKNLNPINKTEDYYFLREILTDINIMNMSTLCGLELPETEEQLHKIMNFLMSKQSFGTKKVLSLENFKNIGIASLLDANDLFEYGILLKPQFTGKGFGNAILAKLMQIATMEGKNVICSIWEKNYPSIKIAKKNGLVFDSQISKIHKGKIININIYKKYETNVCVQGFLITKKVV